MDRHDDFVVALTPLIDVLERLGVAWYVGGSVASTVHGRLRASNDVDVVANHDGGRRGFGPVSARHSSLADHPCVTCARASRR